MNKGSHPSEEAIRKNRLAHLGRKRSLDSRRKQSAAMRERWRTREHLSTASIDKIRQKLLGHPVSLKSRMKNRHGHLGRHHSEETRLKRGLALKGRYAVHQIWEHETKQLRILEERIRLIANAQWMVAV